MSAVVRGDALRIPLRDESVDLIVTSPPYFAQRDYGVAGQLGSEPHPQAFLDALWAVTAECWRVLKPSGSMFVNLGDKRSGSGSPGTTSGLSTAGSTLEGTRQQNRGGAAATVAARRRTQGARSGMTEERTIDQGDLHHAGRPAWRTKAYTRAAFGRPKSKQLIPQRYAIGCEDGLADPEQVGWIVRQELVWWKPNGMPESAQDRCRDAHEPWWHLTKEGDYFAAVDELRQPHARDWDPTRNGTRVRLDTEGAILGRADDPHGGLSRQVPDERGRVPDSVWSIATEPLVVPEHIGVDHFAAFPTEWPRRLILGWSPGAICTVCDTPRAPVLEVEHVPYREAGSTGRPKRQTMFGVESSAGFNGVDYPQTVKHVTIVGYGCACPSPSASTRPAVVLDPFGGTGTTAMVARALGRFGISLDLSAEYSRLARWRVFDSDGAAKVADRTGRDRQGTLL